MNEGYFFSKCSYKSLPGPCAKKSGLQIVTLKILEQLEQIKQKTMLIRRKRNCSLRLAEKTEKVK
jgi:hypothetical protein